MKCLFNAFLSKSKMAKKMRSLIERIVFILRKISIRKRLLLAFTSISIFPIIIVGIYSIYSYEKSLQSKLSLYSEQVLTEISKNINNVLFRYESLTEEIIIDEDIQDGLKNYDKMSDLDKFEYLDKLSTQKLNRRIYGFNNLKNIHIRLLDGRVLYDLGYEIYRDSETARILKGTDESKSNLYFTYTRSVSGSDCIVISRWINLKEDPDQKLGHLMIVVDEKVFANQIYKNVNMGKGSKIFICDSNGVVVSSVSAEIQKGSTYNKNGFFDRLMENYKKNNFTYIDYDGKNKNLIAIAEISPAKWYLVAQIPFSYINSESVEVRNGVVLVSIIVATISVVLCMLIYLSVNIPMKRIVEAAMEISFGKLDTSIDDSNNDEVGFLAKGIRIMVEKLKGLLENVKKEQTAKREAELKMLQAQINPHFLFNTLNSLKWTAMLSKNNTLCEGLEALSGLLKDTIINKNEMVTIENEINNLNNYATIQRIRYGNAFSLVYDIEENLKNVPILKFILQPIVENSIIHGISDDEQSEIEIKIDIYRMNDKLLIDIKDNGKGFDIHSIEHRGKNKKLSGIGLSNVDERIKINYGNEYGIKVQSKPGKGTNVRITLPFIERRESKCIRS
ncbi:MAG TPA: histidine kinase [Clostridiaceae bacterium]|nr:histidine kinase [Clostridiaceae bacterium]